MVNFTILAGGFTSFIATYVFDTDTSALSLTRQNPTGDAVSWIAPSLQNPNILYAVNEISPIGNLQSFNVDAEGALTLVDTVTTGGNGPTFTNPLSTGEITAANFGSPNAAFIAVDPNDPTRFVKDNLQSTVVEFPVNGGPSNPHMTLEHNGEVFVPDLGADKIWRLTRNEAGQFSVAGQIDVTPGNGPRHIAIRDNLLFTLHEKTSSLTVQPIPAAPTDPTLPVIANVSIVPPLAAGFNGSFFAAEIVISEPTERFPNPLIYVSNRNLGPDFDPQGDTIAIFEFSGFSSGSPVRVEAAAEAATSSAADEAATSSAAAEPTAAATTDSAAGPVVTRLQAAPVRRMIKRHARHREVDIARRQYSYGGSYGGTYGGAYGVPAPAPVPAPIPVEIPAEVPTAEIPAVTIVAAPAEAPVVTSTGTTVKLVPSPAPTGTDRAENPATGAAGSLTLVNQVFTGFNNIRSFAIGKVADGGDEFLIAGANAEGGVAVFRRTEGGRNLELVARNTELPSRTSFVFL